MPRPSIVGTTASTPATAAAFITVTVTIPVGATGVFIGFGGFAGGAARTVTSVQDTTGTAFDLDDVTLFNQRADLDQYAGLYGIYDTHANWPSTLPATVDITVTLNSGGQLKACAFSVADIDTAGTPLNGSDVTGENAASIPSMSVTSSANALNVGVVSSYSADTSSPLGDNTTIHSEQNGGSASSLYVWHEDGTASTDTVECSGTVAWSGVAISFEGTGGGGASASLLLLNRSIANNGGMRQ